MTPQELKNSILQLAIQGKLVEQRPEEGTGGELLRDILTQRRRGAECAEKKLTRRRGERGEKADAALSCEEIPDSEKPFDIPESWVWVRLGELLKVIGGVSYDKKDVCNSGLRILRGGNIQNMEILLDDADVFLPEQYRDDEKIVRVGDILIVASTGSKTVIGKAGYIDKPIPQTMIGAFLRICRPSSLEFVGYLRIIFESDFYRKHIRELSQGTNINNIKEAYITQFAIPLPPLAEQKRIVAKIEELLPLIDRYEKAWSKLEDFNKRFPVDMQKSLLQMAIQGKLVDQRPEEGTAAELVEKILAAKNAKGAKGNLMRSRGARGEKKTSALSAPPREKIPDDEKPFDIPESWEWVRLGDISSQITKGTTPRGGNVSYSDKGVGFLRAENIAGLDVLDKSNLKYIDEKTHMGALRRSILEANDILITIAGTLGRTAIVRDNDLPLNANQAVSMIRLVNAKSVSLKYIVIALNGPMIQRILTKQRKVTAIPNLTLEIIRDCLIPLPPLAEQKRIVAKLEELLPLCERLK